MGVLGQLEPGAMVERGPAAEGASSSPIPARHDHEQKGDRARPNVETVIHADGFGIPRHKIKTYIMLVRDQPVQYCGFKLFFEQDTDLLSPVEVLEVLEPNPTVVSYQ